MIGLLGCCSCGGGASANLTIQTRCGFSTAVGSANYVVKDASLSTIASGTTNASGNATVSVTDEQTYTIETSKTGWADGSASVTMSGNTTKTVDMCPSSVSLTLTSPSCPAIPGTYSVTGDATASGSLTVPGDTVIPLSLPATECNPLNIDVTITPSSGYGAAATLIMSGDQNPCTSLSANANFATASGHTQFQRCGNKWFPTTLSYSDSYGSCTLTWNGDTVNWSGYYYGTYSYTSSYKNNSGTRGSGTVTAAILFRIVEASNCGSVTAQVFRRIGAQCAGSLKAFASTPTNTFTGDASEAGTQSSASCDSAINYSIGYGTFGQATFAGSGSWYVCRLSDSGWNGSSLIYAPGESGGTATITGSIS